MIVVNIYGGLGNQLFQYAAGRQLAEKNHTRLKLDIRNLADDKLRHYSLDHFNIKASIYTPFDKIVIKAKERISKVLNTVGVISSRAFFKEQDLTFDHKIPNLGNNIYLDGYWGNEKYFKKIEGVIRDEFRVKEPPEGLNETYIKKMRSTNSVAVHIRRGDYVSDMKTHAFHGICSISYYQDAVALLSTKISNPFFFIFSDDIPWVKQNLVLNEFPVEYLEHNSDMPQEDLRLMYSCKHNVIANSSFSWWGGWLNNYIDKIVIAPAKWNNVQGHDPDLPPQWIKLQDPDRA